MARTHLTHKQVYSQPGSNALLDRLADLDASADAADIGVADGQTDASNSATVADDNVVAGVTLTHIVAIADGASADKDITITYKFEVQDVTVVKTAGAGAASNTVTVGNAGTAITNAMDMNVADKAIVRAGTIDDAANVISAGGTLRVSHAKSGGNAACRVYVRGVKRA